MIIASCDEKDVWVANVYFGVDEKATIYFVSSKDTKHSQMILKNPKVAFSIAWFDTSNHKNRESGSRTWCLSSGRERGRNYKWCQASQSKFPRI